MLMGMLCTVACELFFGCSSSTLEEPRTLEDARDSNNLELYKIQSQILEL